MTGQQADIQWYIAREGKQHGPLSDTEMRTFVAQGHLKPTDLIWRAGFADWRPAPAVFPFPQADAAPPPPPAPAAPAATRWPDSGASQHSPNYGGDTHAGGMGQSRGLAVALKSDLSKIIAAVNRSLAFTGVYYVHPVIWILTKWLEPLCLTPPC